MRSNTTASIAAVLALGAGLATSTASFAAGTKTTYPLSVRLQSVVDAQRSGADPERLLGSVIRDQSGRVLLTATLDGRVPLAAIERRLSALGFEIVASNARYRHGIISFFAPVQDVERAISLSGLRALRTTPRPITRVGDTTAQGTQVHRTDVLIGQGFNGSGLTIGALSDSYDTGFESDTAAENVASGDLPGPGNPNGFTDPVFVLEDLPPNFNNLDEGRAMLQIIHDMAPGARLCFATAFLGPVAFAESIRDLADPGLPCDADLLVDDIGYLTQPFFADGVIAQAAAEVVANGIPYFSSAGNTAGNEVVDRAIAIVDAGDVAAQGASEGLDFTGVPADLYDLGVVDVDPGPGVEIGQRYSFIGGSRISLQWDDPFDLPFELGDNILTTSGEVTGPFPDVFTFDATAGQLLFVEVKGDIDAPNTLPDVVLTVRDPTGQIVGTSDGVIDDPVDTEEVSFQAELTGTYFVIVEGFQGATGAYVGSVDELLNLGGVTTDINLLVFDAETGDFLTAFGDNNFFTNDAVEFFDFPDLGIPTTETELVFARASRGLGITPQATRVRLTDFGGGASRDFTDFGAPAIFGHPGAEGAVAVAAFDYQELEVPEGFTSPGNVTILIDEDGNRLASPIERQKPELAAVDGVNTTFFGSDSDGDGFPNFFGTSAAAPAATAVAAVVLDALGGPGSLTPADLVALLQATTFDHDLDPHFIAGGINAGGIVEFSASVKGNTLNAAAEDTNGIRIEYVAGPAPITVTRVIVAVAPAGLEFDNNDPGVGGFPFTLGRLEGIDPADITQVLPAPNTKGAVLLLNVAQGAFGPGDVLSFGIDRDFAGAGAGNSADYLDGAVVVVQVTTAGGTNINLPFTLENGFGSGITNVDGAGLVDAVGATSP